MRKRTVPPQKAPRIVDSPVQGVITILDNLFSDCPQPRVNTEAARSSGELLGRHLLNLIQSCGELNLTGYHSVAITLFRPLEDALDCLAAVTTVAGAAERWRSGNLKPSDAAKLWVQKLDFKTIMNESFSEYRRRLRSVFNPFSHCSPLVPEWDVFIEKHPDKADLFRLRINHENHVIISNAHSVDAFLVAHLWEVLAVIEYAYRNYFEIRKDTFIQLKTLKPQFRNLLNENHKHGLLNTVYPPELEPLLDKFEQKPKIRRLHEHWKGFWSCSSAVGEQHSHLTISHREWGLVGTLTTEVVSGKITYKITERLSGAIEGSRFVLDGWSTEIIPFTDKVRYELDTFELNLSKDGNELAGTHSCKIGTGKAVFKRAK